MAVEQSEHRTYIGLGSNVGDRRRALRCAVEALSDHGTIEAVSSVYSTEPVGLREQPWFWNLAVRLATRLRATELLAAMRAIEVELGRRPGPRYGPRTIDIDLLLYDDAVISMPALEVPHPALMDRAFVLRPLIELAPDLAHPMTGERFADRLARGNFERTRRLFEGAVLIRR
ncbi:MAG: 2-amino-4-hydroxy-6-hydroxymethyldihydropteridine diphosphokinase [Longimicrobiales bacterium]